MVWYGMVSIKTGHKKTRIAFSFSVHYILKGKKKYCKDFFFLNWLVIILELVTLLTLDFIFSDQSDIWFLFYNQMKKVYFVVSLIPCLYVVFLG